MMMLFIFLFILLLILIVVAVFTALLFPLRVPWDVFHRVFLSVPGEDFTVAASALGVDGGGPLPVLTSAGLTLKRGCLWCFWLRHPCLAQCQDRGHGGLHDPLDLEERH